ncbi:MAG: hypothetical protein ACRD0K_01830 [Egibacteraceae bacterium]
MGDGEVSAIVAAAEVIRQELPELLEAGTAEVDRRLAELIAAAREAEPEARDEVEARIVRLLEEQPPTRERLAELLDVVPTLGGTRGYQPTAGGGLVGALRFACPKDGCEYVEAWVDVSEALPKECKKCHSPLTILLPGS